MHIFFLITGTDSLLCPSYEDGTFLKAKTVLAATGWKKETGKDPDVQPLKAVCDHVVKNLFKIRKCFYFPEVYTC